MRKSIKTTSRVRHPLGLAPYSASDASHSFKGEEGIEIHYSGHSINTRRTVAAWMVGFPLYLVWHQLFCIIHFLDVRINLWSCQRFIFLGFLFSWSENTFFFSVSQLYRFIHIIPIRWGCGWVCGERCVLNSLRAAPQPVPHAGNRCSVLDPVSQNALRF